MKKIYIKNKIENTYERIFSGVAPMQFLPSSLRATPPFCLSVDTKDDCNLFKPTNRVHTGPGVCACVCMCVSGCMCVLRCEYAFRWKDQGSALVCLCAMVTCMARVYVFLNLRYYMTRGL